MQSRKPAVSLFVTLGFVVMSLAPQVVLSDHNMQQYKITITNPSAGQPLTPPVLATHTRNVNIFSLGENSSSELQAIAESGFIISHPGIGGGNDLLSNVHNWSDPVAMIFIERVHRGHD